MKWEVGSFYNSTRKSGKTVLISEGGLGLIQDGKAGNRKIHHHSSSLRELLHNDLFMVDFDALPRVVLPYSKFLWHQKLKKNHDRS